MWYMRTWWLEAPTTKSEDLTPILRSHVAEESWILQVAL